MLHSIKQRCATRISKPQDDSTIVHYNPKGNAFQLLSLQKSDDSSPDNRNHAQPGEHREMSSTNFIKQHSQTV